MAFYFPDLDEATRGAMLQELEGDLAAGNLYLASRLSPTGRVDYERLLREAIRDGDEVSLADQLGIEHRLNQTEMRRTRSGMRPARVPVTAAKTLAEGEFNRFYIRGLCRRAVAAGIGELVIYRARESANPRPESVAREGASIDAAGLLADLRDNPGVDTALGLPTPNSGMSVRFDGARPAQSSE